MYGDRISVRVRYNRHSTDRTFERFKDEFYVAGAQRAHGGIEIVDLESDGRPITRRFPFFPGHVAECESRGTHVVFYPFPIRIFKGPSRFEFQYAFVKGSRAFHVGHRVPGKC